MLKDESASSSATLPSDSFDISKHISLVSMFCQREVDLHFCAFECIASALQRPSKILPLLFQCKIHSKAQEAVAALFLEDSLKYETFKAAILRAYELVPET